jgi:hypothetical protein
MIVSVSLRLLYLNFDRLLGWLSLLVEQGGERGDLASLHLDLHLASGVWAASRRSVRVRSAASSAEASTDCRTRRIVDSCGTTTPIPSSSSTASPASWAYSAIATKRPRPGQHRARCDQQYREHPCLTPRAARGSGTAARASTSDNTANPAVPDPVTSSSSTSTWSRTATIGEDDSAGTGFQT